jgi:hypothetical protein
MLGVCGLDCGKCPAFIATQKNDNELREETAKKWAHEFGYSLKAADINCNGCTKKGVKFMHCGGCEVRKCGMNKKVPICAECREYPCAKIKKLHARIPDAKKSCDEIRKK